MLESQLELEFSPDKSTAGYRLHELSLLNWGTFHENVYTIRPDGRTAMITGRNGSGKSTLVDALLTLLVPNRVRNYNVASSSGALRLIWFFTSVSFSGGNFALIIRSTR